jgi:hypothetical protein
MIACNCTCAGDDLWPRWFRRSGVRDELLAEIASSEPPTFLVRPHYL